MDFLTSLMEFQARVLAQAKTPDLNQSLFFNQIFMSNTNEMFQKYDMRPVMDKYIDMVGEYIYNMDRIVDRLNAIEGIKVGNSNCFERRFLTRFEVAKNGETLPMDCKFQDGEIYYITTGENQAIRFIDSKHSIYSRLFSCDMGDYTYYWPTVESVRSYYESEFGNTVAVRITLSRNINADGNREITKVDYIGDTSVMKSISHIFGSRALIIKNRYMFTKDIGMIIKPMVFPKKELQKFNPVHATDTMDKDYVIEYPNDTFNDYLEFLRSAVKDADTKSIYITIYRIGKDPSIYYILKEAVANGINVTANIELTASGDEAENLAWMEEFQQIGVRVLTYQSFRVKVHCKLTLVEFNNGKSVVQIGTGNYHTKTSTQYTDLNLITSNDAICNNAKKVFTKLFEEKPVEFTSSKFLITRYNFRTEFAKLVAEQTALGKDGYICIKCNTLSDSTTIKLLTNAALAGVYIDLIIRGVCLMIPVTDNVHIRSIVWDKLEHSRVYCFGKSNPKIYIGSLDLKTSKIINRIEVMVQAIDPAVSLQLVNYLNRYTTTTEGTWIMDKDGTYHKL